MEIFLTWVLPILIGLSLGYLLLGRTKVKTQHIERLDDQTFRSNMRKGQLIDVRKKDTYEKNKIKGARNFSPRYLKSKHQTKIRKDKPVYLYCDNGIRSHRTARALSKKNFTKLYVLNGGLNRSEKQK